MINRNNRYKPIKISALNLVTPFWLLINRVKVNIIIAKNKATNWNSPKLGMDIGLKNATKPIIRVEFATVLPIRSPTAKNL